MIRLGLRGEILFAFALVTLFAIGLNTVVVLQLDGLLIGRERVEDTRTLSRVAATSLGRNPSQPALEDLIASEPSILALQTLDSAGLPKLFAGTPSVPRSIRAERLRETALLGDTRVELAGLLAEGGQLLEVVTPLGPATRPSGALVMWRRMGAPTGSGGRRALTILYVALDALVAGSLGWYLIARAVVRPLRRLTEATRRVADGDLGVRVPSASSNELGDLARDFNLMTVALSEKEALLARQVEELRRANASLQAAREEIVQQEKLASVGRLAAGVAHELGNPVGAVTGYVSVLLRGKAEDKSEDTDMLRRIEREMKRIDRIIRDLLDFARPREKQAETFDVNETVDAALAIVSVQAAFKTIQVERRRGDTGNARGDSHRLQQVVVNLLINAADAMEGRDPRRIVVETSLGEFPAPAFARRRDDTTPAGAATILRVTDSGPGIKQEHLSLLFEPFFTTKDPGRGTGLGLAISRTIVESMGGRILVESPPGAGATFSVLLPRP